MATGESFTSPQQFAELLAHDTVHILQPDPGNMGGIWRTRQVCAMADAHYAVVAPHQAQGPICTAVCVQIGAATPNLMTQELFDEFNVDWEREIALPPVEVRDGRIIVPDRPGLGVDLNWSERTTFQSGVIHSRVPAEWLLPFAHQRYDDLSVLGKKG